MITIKVVCVCGQKFAFDVEPVNGRMPYVVKCPVCGADGTASANDLITQKLAAAPPAAAAPAAPAHTPAAAPAAPSAKPPRSPAPPGAPRAVRSYAAVVAAREAKAQQEVQQAKPKRKWWRLGM